MSMKSLRSHALQICDLVGIGAGDAFNEEDMEELKELKEKEKRLKDTPILNKTQGSQVEMSLAQVLAKKNILTNMKVLGLLEELIDTYIQLKAESTSQYLFNSETYTTSEILFFSHLYANTADCLANPFIKNYLKQKYPELLRLTARFARNSGIEKDQPQDSAKVTLFGAVRDNIKSYI
ncbi:unnamed protein product [Ambrosiozyma monospora]|uniref:Unnamed protein product n=1 Tax=Ambrosiozyma monospora TaxID=43982 RepID=A0ACB5TL78_AMBMO|nr:unnamed protein product [Ambrosiozyma monospora]